MYKKYSTSWIKHLDFILIDVLSLHVAYILAYLLRFREEKAWQLPYFDIEYRKIVIVMTFMCILTAIMFRSFSGVLKRNHNREIVETIKHVVLVLGMVMLYQFLMQESVGYSRFVIFITMALYAFFGYGFRMAYKISRRKKLVANKSFLLITTTDKAEKTIETLLKDGVNNGITISGLVMCDRDDAGKIYKCNPDVKYNDIPIVANMSDAVEYMCRQWIDEVFIDANREDANVKRLIGELIEMGVTVHVNLEETNDMLGQNYMVEKIGGYNVITTSINFVTPFSMFLKRLLDIIGGLIGSVFTLIFMVILAPFILIKSPGPLFFKQERVGLNGKRFKMIKFRSMYMDAEERKKELEALNRVEDGMMFKIEWDPRIIGNVELEDGTRKTGIGEFIRKTSLDEFPQFFNVLKGDMSLVGTRPPTLDEWQKYKLHHRARLAVKPGITGMWQVIGRSDITNFEKVVKLDTQYISNWSLWLDIKILFKTVGIVLKHKGAM